MERIYIITPSIISVDDPKNKQLNRFFTDGQLAGDPTLKPDEFTLAHEYERPSFDEATFELNDPKKSWGKILKEDEKDMDDFKGQRTARTRRRARAGRR
jgi:hypothetical protein